MTERKKRGRPSKGDRRVVWCRLQRTQADTVEGLALNREMHVSDVMAALVAVGLAHLDEAGLPEPAEGLDLAV